MTPFIGRARPQLRPPEPNHHNTKGDAAPMTTIEENVAAAQHEVDRRKADYEHARDLYRRAVTVRDDLDAVAAAAAEQSHNSALDERLAEAQQRVYRSRARFERAKQRLERDIRRRDELCPVARAHKAVKNIVDAVQTLTEEPAPAPTLDSDPRTPADQAHEFFTRPGDFYQVALALPAPTNGAKLGAGFIVKADDTQLPYLLEVLRQLRGALGDGTRVELTKAQITPPDGPPMEIGKDFTLGDRFPASPGVPIPRLDGVQLGTGALTRPAERELQMGDLVDQVDQIAQQHGVKPEQVHVIPVRGGGHAFTVKPEPQPERGRHARPDDWESVEQSARLGDHHDD
ncbi:hypothetical protein D2E95_01825 [Mycobacteroides abscessus]|uniref:hypothetical protein n=1 Tax=Mycobacteroides abscessus TaxID=36809 RepID=UPI0009A8341D|nr:hypothetical protein [Mycobacteroides abscessus]RIT64087.1 hypothetical protein D2E95_01825 [Mycobacteroides abscessus]RIU49877.1 hypothetical protein D2F02_16140 [Mycobacteroides abscessus]